MNATEGSCSTPSASGKFKCPAIGETLDIPKLQPTLTTSTVLPGSVEKKIAMNAKYERRQRMIREIAASQLLQEELAKTDPNLASVTSFMNSVCGNAPGAQKLSDGSTIHTERDTG